MERMLDHLHALDLTDDKGFLCGKILADLGVNVIKIERPGGDPSRNIGGFRGGKYDPEKSLYWWAYNSNKKGITPRYQIGKRQKAFPETCKPDRFCY
jgi:crotonobetainyl-CoA:carnitine CoA-transferase CaiB-like acyl-CoA transferase